MRVFSYEIVHDARDKIALVHPFDGSVLDPLNALNIRWHTLGEPSIKQYIVLGTETISYADLQSDVRVPEGDVENAEIRRGDVAPQYSQ